MLQLLPFLNIQICMLVPLSLSLSLWYSLSWSCICQAIFTLSRFILSNLCFFIGEVLVLFYILTTAYNIWYQSLVSYSGTYRCREYFRQRRGWMSVWLSRLFEVLKGLGRSGDSVTRALQLLLLLLLREASACRCKLVCSSTGGAPMFIRGKSFVSGRPRVTLYLLFHES